MKRDIRITGIKKKEIDDEKLALAFLLLARSIDTEKTDRNTRKPDGSEKA
jgi:hypothetical protein